MTDQKPAKEKLQKRITELKDKVREKKGSEKSTEVRKLRKELKRAQRRLACLNPPNLQQKIDRNQKTLDHVTKQLTELTKNTKKTEGDPYVHSLRKKVKSLEKRIKHDNRLVKKKAEAAPKPAEEPKAEGSDQPSS